MRALNLSSHRWRAAFALALMMVVGSAYMSAQRLYVVPGQAAAPKTMLNYDYPMVYPYPNNVYEAHYDYMFYDYMTINKSQYVIRAADMLAAGMCAGPISSLGYRFISAVRWDMELTIKMKHIPASQNTLTPPWQTGLTQVYYNSNYTLNPIALNDTTWVDWQFQNNFTWDGASNIVVEICRKNLNTTLTYNTIATRYYVTHVNPPNGPYNQYPGNTAPWIHGYSYTFSPENRKNCDNPQYGAYTLWGDRYDYNNYVYEYYKPFRPLVRLGSATGVVQSFPDDQDPRRILKSGDNYNGSDAAHPKPSITFFQSPGTSYQFSYRVVGPLPSTNVVYEARMSGNSLIPYTGTGSGQTTYTFTDASGPYAGTGGALDLTNAVGGAYRVESDFYSPCGVTSWLKAFVVAFPNDVALSQIRSPQALPKKHPININLPLAAQIQNVGLNPVTDVDISATVRTYPGGAVVTTEETNWTGNLNTGDRANVDFPTGSFIPTVAGKYTVEYCATLNNAIDQGASNNCQPFTGEQHIFEVTYNEEAAAGTIIVPSSGGRFFANRPMRPEGTVLNTGILDLTDVPVRMQIYKINGAQRDLVYNRTAIVPSIDAAVPLNIALVQFPLFTPPDGGSYEACMTTEMPGDQVAANNRTCVTFTVDANLSGVYTIGSKNAGKPRNYGSIQQAVDDLFLKGVSGPVTFEFTDAEYSVGFFAPNAPALDLTTAVVGMSATNTVTFKPTLDRSLTKGAVTIRMNTANGIGILFGQSLFPNNTNALAREFPNIRQFSNSTGYFRFDGGTQKSLRFEVNATTPHRSAFYLQEGSSNVEVKNCVITNAPNATASYTTNLPQIFFVGSQFVYENDTRTVSGNTLSYSAGIVSRAKVPVGTTGNNGERLDTLVNVNNTFSGNEISGFGYGVVSLGMGTLIKGGVNVYTPYYNQNTTITNNVITNVAAAGVMIGHEDKATVAGNRIYNVGKVTGAAIKNAMGIQVGGVNTYNTMDARILANEISGVSGDSTSRGVVVEQVRNDYQNVSSTGGIYSAPARPEHTIVGSNVVWGLRRGVSTGSIAGVHLLTRRMNNDILTPHTADYFTRQDTVANNTVYIESDGLTGPGAIVGIGSQQGNGTVVVNNAIAITAPANAATFAQTALLSVGTLFRETPLNREYLPANAPNPMMSNYNAFWAPNSTIARFVEVAQNSGIVSAGTTAEFQTIDQWRSWTGQDRASVVGNFVAEHELQGIAPNQKLRVKITPQPPIGSILNNRGVTVKAITSDVDGNVRNETGIGYDIGADEFQGRLYLSDVEVMDILSPSSYRSTTGTTSDAEYIMTKAPVDVKARVRNSGALATTRTPVRVRIFMETPTSNNTNLANPTWGGAVVDRTIYTDLQAGQIADLTFNVPNFTPQTYFGLAGYTTPSRFASMAANVTPRYRVEVTAGFDENGANNTFAKTVRFYIQKSQMSIVVSAVGTTNNITTGTPTANQIAGKLNADSLIRGFNHIGWVNNPAANAYAYDVFERSAWEGRAVNYNIYRSLFWSHDQTALTRTERSDIRNFVRDGQLSGKKNLVVGSQDIPRNHVGLNFTNDEEFVNKVLRVDHIAPGTPAPGTYHGKRILGAAQTRNVTETITRTGFAGDADPLPALVRVYSDATTSGMASPSYFYVKGDRTTTDSISGASTGSLFVNTIFLGVDWRHYGRPSFNTGVERVIRGVVDFLESNGGTVVPVELASFDAKARANDVDVFWTTASEQNSDHFRVERSRVSEAGMVTSQDFATIATVPAAGNSTERRDYLTTDRGLDAGTYVYRLVSVDHDGSTARSQDVQVVIVDGSALSLNDVVPNPVANEAQVTFSLGTASDIQIVLVDANGTEVATLFSGFHAAGSGEVTLSTTKLSSGSYTLVIRDGSGLFATKTVNVVK